MGVVVMGEVILVLGHLEMGMVWVVVLLVVGVVVSGLVEREVVRARGEAKRGGFLSWAHKVLQHIINV